MLGGLEATQTTLEDAVPLDEVDFCVLDLETTGGSAADGAITEIGAVKLRDGERIGTFHSLVDPRTPIPRFITHLTGISDRDVAEAPPIGSVMPSLLEFLRGSVLVAHNARYDVGFLNAALSDLGYAPLADPPVCTARLARRIVWPDVPNVKLRTLAEYFRTSVRPSHRAFDDASATAEVFQGLVRLGERLGIRTLGELREACRARGRPNFGKIRLADHLPNAPGVYLFRGRDGTVLYIGKSTDLRARVRSYFYGDERKKVEHLLEQVTSVDGVVCASETEALVLEARLIRTHEPTFNRQGTTWRRAAYLKLDPTEAWPRLKVVRRPDPRTTLLGPFPDRRSAVAAKEALEEVFPIRRCTTAMGRSTRFSPCALADIGRCRAPCDGSVESAGYGELVAEVLRSVTDHGRVLVRLDHRLSQLAAEERYEEAALLRDRIRALTEALARSRTDAWLTAPERMELRAPDGELLRFRHGSLLPASPAAERLGEAVRAPGIELPCATDRAHELGVVRAAVRAGRLHLEDASTPLAEPVGGGRLLAELLDRLREGSRRSSPRTAGRRQGPGDAAGPT